MAILSTSGTWTVGSNWPWPRLFITDYYLLAIAVDGINLSLYELYSDGSDFTAVKIQTLGALANVNEISLSFAERHYVVSVFSFTDDVPTINMWGRWARAVPGENAMVPISSDYIPGGTALCYFKGQLLVGGLKTNSLKWAELGQCAVAWGGIGNVTFDPVVEPMAGFAKMPWDRSGKNKVYYITQYGENEVVVYGSGGIEKLTPFGNDVITGFGQSTIQQGGVLGFGCAGGTKDYQCFIDNAFNLCTLTDNIKVLGYKNYMKKLMPERVIISFDPLERNFYITDGIYCFVLTSKGLYETHQCPTSIGRIDGTLTGFIKHTSQAEIKLETTEIDLKSSGLKTVNSVEYNVDYETSVNAQLYGSASARYTHKGEMITGRMSMLNNEGTFFPFITGRSFKFLLQGDYIPNSTFNLSSIKVNASFIDARTRRGLSDTTSRT